MLLAASIAGLWGLAQDTTPTIRTSINEVVVDVVVRDKKGKIVRGLKASDFHILEDGVPQPITSLRESSGSLTPASVSDATPAPPGPNTISDPSGRQVRLFSLVFDRLAIDSRRLARQAAYDLLKEDLAPDVYAGVFLTDQRLHVVQTYTKDRVKLKAAIDKIVGANAPTNYADANTALQNAKDSTSSGASSATDGGGLAAEAMNRMVTDMLEFAETSGREQQGRFSIFGLWGIVKEQFRLPGRKTVLYFSEGLQLPSALLHQFQSMVSDANRANVSIYAIDSRGLSVSGDSGLAQDMMNRNLKVSQGAYRGSSGAVTREEAMQFDRALDAIHANPQVALQNLAESTGGFLIANMNDFRKPIQRVVEDVGAYYEILYRPLNTSLDGKFRAIEIKAPAYPDYRIQARIGYFALPSRGLQPFEVPLLQALEKRPLQHEVEFRSTVVPFDPGRAVIIFDMPMKDLTFRQDPLKPVYRSHFSFLALIQDDHGQVVDKISRELNMEEPADKLEGFRQGRAIFTKAIRLGPGKYTLESAVSDLQSNKFGARRVALVVPPKAESTLVLSGLTMIRRTDKAPPNPDRNDPYIVLQNRIVPTLDDRVTGKAMSIYFVVYPAGSEKPSVTMEFFREERKLGEGSPELSPPLPDGRIPYIANIPVDGWPSGLYEVRVTARQGSVADRQSIFVTVENQQ
jgi:VWFA-related protein